MIRQARQEETAGWPAAEREAALAETEAYLEGRVPEAVAARVRVLAPLEHIWAAFWDLASTRPITTIPVGMGASIPIREAIPYNHVTDYLDERNIPECDRPFFRRMLAGMDSVYREYQMEALSKAAPAENEDGDEEEGGDG